MKENFDYSISLCRITAMVMIIICHFGTALKNSVIGEFFQVGIYLFLFISGYLYGNRKINNYNHWIKERLIKIYIPYYVFICYAICLNIFILNRINILMLVLSFLNLQGYHHIFNEMHYLQPIEGCAHLWYLTVLLLCYLLTIVIKEIEKRKKLCKNNIIKLLLGLLFVFFILGLKGIRIDYFVTYFIGYFYSRRKTNCKGDYYISILLFIIGCFMRLSMKKYCDIHGDNNLYLYVIIPFSYNLLSFCIFKTVTFFAKYLKVLYKKSISRKIMIYIDALSLYIYIVHYQFIDAPISLIFITKNIFYNICLICIFTTVGAIILKMVSEIIINTIHGKERRYF